MPFVILMFAVGMQDFTKGLDAMGGKIDSSDVMRSLKMLMMLSLSGAGLDKAEVKVVGNIIKDVNSDSVIRVMRIDYMAMTVDVLINSDMSKEKIVTLEMK